MEQGLLELFVLLLTVGLSAAAAGASTFYLNRSKELLGFLGAKAETLYSELEILDRILADYFAKTYSIVEGSVWTPEPDRGVLESACAHFATIKMLIGFYLPTLSSGLARTAAAAATAHRALLAAQGAPPSDQSDAVDRLDSAVCELKDAFEALKGDVLREGRDIARRGAKAFACRPTSALSQSATLKASA